MAVATTVSTMNVTTANKRRRGYCGMTADTVHGFRGADRVDRNLAWVSGMMDVTVEIIGMTVVTFGRCRLSGPTGRYRIFHCSDSERIMAIETGGRTGSLGMELQALSHPSVGMAATTIHVGTDGFTS